MKTTLNIPAQLMRRLKQEAARRGTTMSSLVEGALRAFLDPKNDAVGNVAPLPVFHVGRSMVDVSDRDELYDVLDERR
jgi:hypothetical protein